MKWDDVSRILIIQTAYIGDVILMTPLLENLRTISSQAQIDVLVNRNNASVLAGHPHINRLLLWDKKVQKNRNLLRLLRKVRANRYDIVLNCHRFASSGMLTVLSRATYKVGFSNNPLAKWYDFRAPHHFSEGTHEVDRNLALLDALPTHTRLEKYERNPKLYPTTEDETAVVSYRNTDYLCVAPTSVWFTKQFLPEKWVQLINQLAFKGNIYLLGGTNDFAACENIRQRCKRGSIENLAGKLNLLQSAALMKGAVLNYVNDSAPLHLASAMNAPVCAVFCSTVPRFGFTPLSDFAEVIEIDGSLECRPCGLHGHSACPEKHFRCARDIQLEKLIDIFDRAHAAFKS